MACHFASSTWLEFCDISNTVRQPKPYHMYSQPSTRTTDLTTDLVRTQYFDNEVETWKLSNFRQRCHGELTAETPKQQIRIELVVFVAKHRRCKSDEC